MNYDDKAFERVVLDVLNHHVEARIHELDLYVHREPIVHVSRVAHELVMRAIVPFAGQRLDYPTVKLRVSYPATWWQAFKLAHFPGWARRRWPVVMKHVEEEHEFNATLIYDQVKVPEFAHHICVDVKKKSSRMWMEP